MKSRIADSRPDTLGSPVANSGFIAESSLPQHRAFVLASEIGTSWREIKAFVGRNHRQSIYDDYHSLNLHRMIGAGEQYVVNFGCLQNQRRTDMDGITCADGSGRDGHVFLAEQQLASVECALDHVKFELHLGQPLQKDLRLTRFV